jgi:hypothetical protein
VLGYWNYLNPAGEWRTITNDLYHFSVEYPTKWSTRIYGENGHRGADEVKLRIYRSFTGYFEIAVQRKEAIDPSVNDVADWGEDRIERLNRIKPRSRESYQELDFRVDFVEGNKVFVRRYADGEITKEDVYIARENDMIIITLQSETDDFDEYLEDFYRIVDSFRTVE